MKQALEVVVGEGRREPLPQAERIVAVRAAVVGRFPHRHLGEAPLAAPLADQVLVGPELDVELLQREGVEPVRALARVDHEAGDHRVEGDTPQRHAGAAQHQPVVLDVVADLAHRRVAQECDQRRQRRVAQRRQVDHVAVLQHVAGGPVREGQVPRLARRHGDRQADQVGAHRVEARSLRCRARTRPRPAPDRPRPRRRSRSRRRGTRRPPPPRAWLRVLRANVPANGTPTPSSARAAPPRRVAAPRAPRAPPTPARPGVASPARATDAPDRRRAPALRAPAWPSRRRCGRESPPACRNPAAASRPSFRPRRGHRGRCPPRRRPGRGSPRSAPAERPAAPPRWPASRTALRPPPVPRGRG